MNLSGANGKPYPDKYILRAIIGTVCQQTLKLLIITLVSYMYIVVFILFQNYLCFDVKMRLEKFYLLYRPGMYNNVTTPYYPTFALLSVKWSLMGGCKQTKISNF